MFRFMQINVPKIDIINSCECLYIYIYIYIECVCANCQKKKQRNINLFRSNHITLTVRN
jgi:hypothetical protein